MYNIYDQERKYGNIFFDDYKNYQSLDFVKIYSRNSNETIVKIKDKNMEMICLIIDKRCE